MGDPNHASKKAHKNRPDPVRPVDGLLRPLAEPTTVAPMPTVATTEKSARPAAAKRPRTGRKLMAGVLPLPAATAPAGPISADELASLGAGVDFASIKHSSERRHRRAR